MNKKSKKSSANDDLEIPETPPAFFKTAVMGKYYNEYVSPTGAVARHHRGTGKDVAKVFTNSKSVNDVLRAIIRSMSPSTTIKRKKSA